ncbi:B-cell receptor CD22-like isoform X2 [Hyla sarda]|nr:B-cell receptor CD22-like isoform X2 [Hyla sarda]
MDAVKPVYLLLICQGFYLGSEGQYWTIPSTITALIGSCVEIPCTFILGTSELIRSVWYLHIRGGYAKILNSEDSSSVLQEYRGRTSLVPGQGCTLRIDPVRREDGNRQYYPGATGDASFNAYDQQSTTVNLLVTASVNMQLNGLRAMTEGEAIAIRCTADHTCRSSRPSIQWNKPGQVVYWSLENSGGSWREESQLTYIASYEDNGSQLQCIATYHNGQRYMVFRNLIIYHGPKNVIVTVIGKNEVIEGSNVTLQCNSVSNPDVSKYEWYKGKKKTRLEYTGRKIIVRKVTGNMEPYSCAAINLMGRGESALMEIPVLYAPKNLIVTVIGKDEVIEGSDVTLQCNSVSNPDVSEYEWYKGKKKTRLQYTGPEITVRKVTGNMEPYSCAAINLMGRGESALMEIPVLYEPPGTSSSIVPAVIGVICLLLLVLLVYCCWR